MIKVSSFDYTSDAFHLVNKIAGGQYQKIMKYNYKRLENVINLKKFESPIDLCADANGISDTYQLG